MQVPLELSFRGVDKSEALTDLVLHHARRLERFCDHIDSCRVVIERPHHHQSGRAEHRVRIDMTIAAGKELVAEETSDQMTLAALVRAAFHTAERRVKELNHQQHGQVKHHAEQLAQGIVSKLFSDYGFVATADGREVYFHENSVINIAFDELVVGMGVAFNEEAGREGPQASSLRVVDRRAGLRSSASVV
jgi:cold shock CspA family protein